MQLNIENWKRFKISQLFDCIQSKGDNQAKDLETGDIPLVSAGKTRNGIV